MRYVQFCDAHAGRPADMQEIIRQARGDRLLPGEGALDLRGLLHAPPAEACRSAWKFRWRASSSRSSAAQQVMAAARKFLDG